MTNIETIIVLQDACTRLMCEIESLKKRSENSKKGIYVKLKELEVLHGMALDINDKISERIAYQEDVKDELTKAQMKNEHYVMMLNSIKEYFVQRGNTLEVQQITDGISG